MEARDFAASVKSCDVYNEGQLKTGVVEWLADRATKQGNLAGDPISRVMKRVGKTALESLNLSISSIFEREGKTRGWIRDSGKIIVRESREEVTRLVITEMEKLGKLRPKESVVKSALPAFVDFRRSRRLRNE